MLSLKLLCPRPSLPLPVPSSSAGFWLRLDATVVCSFKVIVNLEYCTFVTIQQPLYREVFWHEYAKIPRHTSQNAITEGDFKCILARNCEDIEQLRTFVL